MLTLFRRVLAVKMLPRPFLWLRIWRRDCQRSWFLPSLFFHHRKKFAGFGSTKFGNVAATASRKSRTVYSQ